MNILREILWVILALIIASVIQLPILKEIDYKFVYINTFIIVVSVIYLRYNLFFETTIGKLNKWIRYILFSMNFFLLVVVILKSQKIIELNDIFSLELYQESVKNIDKNIISNLLNYINFEFLLASTVLIANTLVLSVKILKSFWINKPIKDF